MPAAFDIPQYDIAHSGSAAMRPVAAEVRDISQFRWRDATLGERSALPRLWPVQLSGVVLTGTAGHDTLIGGSGDDTLYGLDGNDNLQGASGDDTLYAGDGDDILIGGTGNDTLYGDTGNDAYYFGLGDGHDVIHSFDHEAQFFVTLNLKLGIHPNEVELERSGVDLIVYLISGETITLAGYFPPLDDPWQWPRAVDEFWFQENFIWEASDILAKLESDTQARANGTAQRRWTGATRPPAAAQGYLVPASAQVSARSLQL